MVQQCDLHALQDLLAEDVVFHSPLVHMPQRGKAITLLYVSGPMQVLDNTHFRYDPKIVGPRDALLEFSTDLDGIQVNGVDHIR